MNSLNVYPVPDGDTGTNLLLTQESVVSAIAGSGDGAGLEELGSIIARASLLAARGNSGVILSQILRGLCEAAPASGSMGPGEFARALGRATEQAYRAVARPAEGTVLSVMRDASRAATEAAQDGRSCAEVAGSALEEARAALARTKDELAELREAGVVDAGGKGIVLLLDALRAAITGEEASEPVGEMGPVGAPDDVAPGAGASPRRDEAVAGGLRFAYEVQYLLEADDPSVAGVRRELALLGDSLVVVGGGGLFNVHVHTNEPDGAVEAGDRAGRTREVRVSSLRERVAACLAGTARGVRLGEQTCAVVLVAEGDGLVRTFASLGADVVPGGPGHNPSVADILAAIEAAPADAVLVLPNHPNVQAAAERAAGQSAKDVRVVPARSIPAGLAAATVFNPVGSLDDNAEEMAAAAAACRSGEVARAERGASTPAGPVRAGEWLGLAEGHVVTAGTSPAECATAVAGELATPTSEVLTLVVGDGVERPEGAAVAEALSLAFAALRVEVIDGGQPRYPFLIGVE